MRMLSSYGSLENFAAIIVSCHGGRKFCQGTGGHISWLRFTSACLAVLG
jgi:hypothetical protein